jgi:hypothetical protein
MPPRRRLLQADVRRIADLIRRRGGDHYEVAAQFAQAKGLTTLDRLRIARQVLQQKAIEKAIKR